MIDQGSSGLTPTLAVAGQPSGSGPPPAARRSRRSDFAALTGMLRPSMFCPDVCTRARPKKLLSRNVELNCP